MIFHKMTRPELMNADREAVAVIPLGSTEQHGLHLPVDTDTRLADALCRELERRQPERVLLAPAMWLGHSPHHLDFGGTLSINYDLYSRMLTEVIECFAQMGFHRILMVNGHGGNGMPMAITQQEVKLHRPNLMLCGCNYWELAREELLSLREGGTYAMGHACELETSLYLYLEEGAVRKDKIRDAGCPDESGYFGFGMFNGGPVSYLTNFSEITDTGAFGCPTLASAEKGKRMFEAISEQLEKFILYFSKRDTMIKTMDGHQAEKE